MLGEIQVRRADTAHENAEYLVSQTALSIEAGLDQGAFLAQRDLLAALGEVMTIDGRADYARMLSDGQSLGLRMALEAEAQRGYLTALDYSEDPDYLRQAAWDRQREAEIAERGPGWQHGEGMYWRPDMSQRMMSALGIAIEMAPDPGGKEYVHGAGQVAFDPVTPLSTQEIEHLFAGRRIDGEAIDGKQARVDGVTWLECPFPAPKSVSAEYGVTTPAGRAAIAAAHNEAVDHVMRRVAIRLGRIRLSEDRADGYERGDVTWLVFVHGVSQSGDPQLHSHVVLLNTVVGDTRVGRLDTRQLAGQVQDLRLLYLEHLAVGLERRGYEIAFDREVPETRIATVPKEVELAFSQRTAQAHEHAVERAAMQGHDFDQLPEIAQAKLMSQAVLVTRGQQVIPDPERWRQVAAEHGWTPALVYADRAKAAQTDQQVRALVALGGVRDQQGHAHYAQHQRSASAAQQHGRSNQGASRQSAQQAQRDQAQGRHPVRKAVSQMTKDLSDQLSNPASLDGWLTR